MAHHRVRITTYAGKDEWGNKIYKDKDGNIYLEHKYDEWDDPEEPEQLVVVRNSRENPDNYLLRQYHIANDPTYNTPLLDTQEILASGKRPGWKPPRDEYNAKKPGVLTDLMNAINDHPDVQDAKKNGDPISIIQDIGGYCGSGPMVRISPLNQDNDSPSPPRNFYQQLSFDDKGNLKSVDNYFPKGGSQSIGEPQGHVGIKSPGRNGDATSAKKQVVNKSTSRSSDATNKDHLKRIKQVFPPRQ